MARYDIAEMDFNVAGARFGVVAARFNGAIVDRLLAGAVDVLTAHGVPETHQLTARVPGAFELAVAAKWLIEDCKCDAVIALGTVIRGDTPHFDYVCSEAARGCTLVSEATGRPVTFGVLTVENEEQALARTGGGHGHVGREAALAAMEMVSLRRVLRTEKR